MYGYSGLIVNLKGKVRKKHGYFPSLKMWRLIILGNKQSEKKDCLNHSTGKRCSLYPTDMLPEDSVMLNDEMKTLLVALDDCTGDQKMVIIMRYFQELSIAETAQILSWTEGKVKTTQHRAIKALRERLSEGRRRVMFIMSDMKNRMKQPLDELLKNMPKFTDHRSKEEVYNRVKTGNRCKSQR